MVNSTAPTNEPAACANCGAPILVAEAVPFWDGRQYCSACLESALPGLAQYLRDHPRLEEVTRVSSPFASRIVSGVLMLISVLAIVVAVSTNVLPVSSTEAPIAALVTGALFAILVCVIILWDVFFNKAVISLERGILRVVTPFWSLTRPLSEVRWYRGRNAVDPRFKIWQECVTLWLPIKFCGIEIHHRDIACGQTEESLRLWTLAVSRQTWAGIPRWKDYGITHGIAALMFAVIVGLACAIGWVWNVIKLGPSVKMEWVFMAAMVFCLLSWWTVQARFAGEGYKKSCKVLGVAAAWMLGGMMLSISFGLQESWVVFAITGAFSGTLLGWWIVPSESVETAGSSRCA